MSNKATDIANGSIYYEHLSEDIKRRLGHSSSIFRSIISEFNQGAGLTQVFVVTDEPCAALGLLTIDGKELAAGQRVLRTGEPVQADNGIYIVKTGLWPRANDEIKHGMLVQVTDGVDHHATLWQNVESPAEPLFQPLDGNSAIQILTSIHNDSRAELLARLYDGLNEVYCALCEQQSLLSSVVFQAHTCQPSLVVPTASHTTILWNTININSSVLGYDNLSGVFVPTKRGFYRVTVLFHDDYSNGSYLQNLEINGLGAPDVRDVYTGNGIRTHASKLVYCNGTTDPMSVSISHNSLGSLLYNQGVGQPHLSWIHIEYAGDALAGLVLTST